MKFEVLCFIVFQATVFLGFTVVIWSNFKTYIRRGEWVKVCAQLIPISVVAVLHILGAGMYIIYRHNNGKLDGSIVLITIYTTILFSLGCVLYFYSFKVSYDVIRNLIPNRIRSINRKFLVVFLILFVAVDWYVVIRNISSGVHFSWASQAFEAAELSRATGTLQQVRSKISGLIIPIAIFLYSSSKSKLWLIILAVDIIFALASGSRSALLFLFLDGVLSYLFVLYYYGFGDTVLYKLKKIIMYLSVTAILMFGFLFPVVNIARHRVRANIDKYEYNRYEIVEDYILNRVPNAFIDYLTGNYNSSYGTNYLYRFGKYQDVIVKVVNKYSTTGAREDMAGLYDEIMLPVPRVVFPEKPIVKTDSQIYHYMYDVYPAGGFKDIWNTPFTAAYVYGGPIGVLLLFVLTGVAFGVTLNILNLAGDLSGVFAIGFVVELLPTDGQLLGQLIAARDIVIVFGFIVGLFIAVRRFL